MTFHHGDCLDVMAAMKPESVDAIVTDPPYGLEFMGKEWDGADGFRRSLNMADVGRDNVFGRQSARAPEYRATPLYQSWSQQWAEASYRVAKPSAYLLAFGGTRTVHRMTVALEDAGWIIRDMLVWGYASGFPKSKASLKPAWEPIVMARKPGPLRMLNIDECRIGVEDRPLIQRDGKDTGGVFGERGPALNGSAHVGETSLGRWPANIVLTDPIFDGGIAGVVGGGEAKAGGPILGDKEYADIGYHGNLTMRSAFEAYGDTGIYSRFFMIPKAARSDREPVLGGLPERRIEAHAAGPQVVTAKNWGDEDEKVYRRDTKRQNVHPTVKPTELMRHLVRLVTPAGGTVLDPFLGSGTTALAAEMEGFAWVGIEREAEYIAIAEARLNGVQRGLGLEAS